MADLHGSPSSLMASTKEPPSWNKNGLQSAVLWILPGLR